jgi:hypothetical protein
MQVSLTLLKITCNMQNMQNNMHDMQNMQTLFPICRICTAHFADADSADHCSFFTAGTVPALRRIRESVPAGAAALRGRSSTWPRVTRTRARTHRLTRAWPGRACAHSPGRPKSMRWCSRILERIFAFRGS